VTRHAHAQVRHDQRIADHVIPQPVIREPTQPFVQRLARQHASGVQIERQTHPLRRIAVEQAADRFVIVAIAGLGEHAPYQRVERHGHRAQLRHRNALFLHGVPHAVLGRHAASQPESKVQGAEDQRPHHEAARGAGHSDRDGKQDAQQQRHGVHRIDDEHGGPAFRRKGQRPEQLGAVDGERIQNGMRHQHQPYRQEQPSPAIGRIGPILAYQPGQQHRQAGQHENGMREAAVIGHERHRVRVAHQDIQIRQGGQRRAIDEGASALHAPQHGALNAGAQHRLCN